MASARPKSPSRASLRSFCTACGSTKPSSTGRRRRLPFSEHNGITEFLPHGGKRRPSRDDGDGKFDRFCARVRMDDRDCNIEPPASPYAPSCGGLVPTAERTVGPARTIAESLTSRPGIREHYRHRADIPHRNQTWSYSITSSARASSEGGTVRPSALAVLRFIESSNFVGSSTGRSPGFSPLSMRATYTPAWR